MKNYKQITPWKRRLLEKNIKNNNDAFTQSHIALLTEVSNLQNQIQEMRNEQTQYTNKIETLLSKTRLEVAQLNYGQRKGIKSWARKLLRGLIRERYEFDFKIMSNVVIHDLKNRIWRALGNDPNFELVPVFGRYPNGWILLTGKLLRSNAHEQHNCNAKLYLDYGYGYEEENSLTIPVSQRGTIFELIYLPPNLNSLRWDPIDYPDTFKQTTLIMTQIGILERNWRMWRRVSDTLRNKSKLTCEQVGLTWRSALMDLKTAYYAAGQLRAAYLPLASNYYSWVQNFDTLSKNDRDAILAHLKTLRIKPLISVIMPVYNPPENFLAKAIDSVRNQLYPNWELCIADDNSSNPQIKLLLEKYRNLDSRIKIILRQTNGHISAASNTALTLAQGQWIALLDHDDELAEHALYRVAVEINQYPNAQLIYSDEDLLDTDGQRCHPHFKPDWNPELFYSHNYITHLSVIKHDLLREINGFRLGVEGAQDYDLLLRCTATLNPKQIRHIPEILYHWRMLEGSSTLGANEKPYTTAAGLKALTDYFVKIDPLIKVTNGVAPNFYRVQYPIPDPAPQVTLIIPTRNGYEFLVKCISSILNKTRYKNFEIIIVDNQSDEPKTLKYFDEISKNPKIRVIKYDYPFNYSAINNYAARYANGSILGLINSDIEVVSEDWLNEMVALTCRREIGVVGAKLLYGDGTIQHGGIILGLGGYAAHAHRCLAGDHSGYIMRLKLTQALSGVTAACCLVRKEIFDQLNGFEEQKLTIAYNDVDFCLRVRAAGYRNVWTPYAVLYHYESVTRGHDEDNPEKQARFNREKEFLKQRWGDTLLNDPYYNPNLTLDNEHFSISDRPRVERAWKNYLNNNSSV